MLSLRYYQEEAINSIWAYFGSFSGNPILALPTGTGKSIVIAEFTRAAVVAFPETRILILTHVKELIKQNYEEFIGLWPLAPAGIYSAGLKRKEIRPITFAGIASVHRKAGELGRIDLVIVDECHLISPDAETSYRNLIADLQKINPAVKVIGLTATPYRLGQGKLTEPIIIKDEEVAPIFSHVCYDITSMEAFNRLIAEGYLCKLRPKRTKEELDVSSVHVRGGEFISSELQAAVDREEITRRAVDELIDASWQNPHSNGQPRLRWLIFGAGIEHAEHIADEIKGHGIDARVVHSELGHRERDAIVAWFKAPCDGLPRALVNNGVFTTGFNCPAVDLIGMLRPTSSASLWVQMLGRGTRPFGGKDDCLVLDFAGNTRRLGPINDPIIPKRKGQKGGGDAPVKICEKCGTYNHASVRFCSHCGQEFSRHTKLCETAGVEELIREGQAPQIEIFKVDTITFAIHRSRHEAKPDSLRIVYTCGLRQFSEWVCIEHDGFAGAKARKWWAQRSTLPPPVTTEEANQRVHELTPPSFIRVWVNLKHPNIMAYDFTETAFGTIKPGSVEKTKIEGTNTDLSDEDVPF